MADQKLSQKSTLTKSTIATNDLVYVADVSASATKGITYQELIQPLDTQFAIADNSDTTKKIAFQASGITTGTTRTLTAPDADTTIVGTDTTQTLTNKTLTSPQINMSSNATGDMYYRNSGGTTVRLPIGTTGQILNADATGIPAWVANPAASDASTTVKGVSEEATLAETLARTAAGGTSARLFVNPTNIVSNMNYDYVVDTGTASAYAIAPTPAVTAYVTGQVFTFKAVNANTGTAPTLAVSGLTAKTIVNQDGTALMIGQISANSIISVAYNGTNMQLLSRTQPIMNFGQGTRAGASSTGTQTFAHGLGSVPKLITFWYSANNGNNNAFNTGFGSASSTSVYSFTVNCASNDTNTSGTNTVQGTTAVMKTFADDGTTALSTVTVSALDATNVTLNFTTHSVTLFWQWVAYA